MRFCLALHSGSFLLDARAVAAAGRQKFSEANRSEAELDGVNVPERFEYEVVGHFVRFFHTNLSNRYKFY